MTEGFDASTYGRSFADVYDTWYPTDSETMSAVELISTLCDPGARILELGIGTGRLALPLAQRGYVVSGIDASPAMLELLNSKAAALGIGVNTVCGNAASPEAWPDGPFDLIVGAFNFVFNLVDHADREQLMRNVRERLAERGSLLIETSVPQDPSSSDGPSDRADNSASTNSGLPPPPVERRLEVREVSVDAVILIASSTDHETGLVTGQHIELRDGRPVRLRPWQVRVTHPDQIDSLAVRAGLRLAERFADWNGSTFEKDSVHSIARYVLSSGTSK